MSYKFSDVGLSINLSSKIYKTLLFILIESYSFTLEHHFDQSFQGYIVIQVIYKKHLGIQMIGSSHFKV